MTRRAARENSVHLNHRAQELNQLTDGYNMMSKLLIPDNDERAKMMENLYNRSRRDEDPEDEDEPF